MEQDGSISRREALTWAGGGTLAFTGIGGASVVFSGSASATVQVDAEDMEATTPDGKVEEINFHVGDAEATYSNVDPDVEGFVFTTHVDGNEIFQHSFHKVNAGAPEAGFDIGSDSGSIPYHSGIDRPGGSGMPLFANSSYVPSQFEVPEDGASETFTFDVEVEFGVYTEDGSADDPAVTATGSDTATLTIINEEDGSDSGGGGGGGGGGDGGSTPDPEASFSGAKVSLSVELPNGDRVTE